MIERERGIKCNTKKAEHPEEKQSSCETRGLWPVSVITEWEMEIRKIILIHMHPLRTSFRDRGHNMSYC
ncbi:hypothetical protein RRG08_029785 [Elysia crispata]|uniref:Uncharacterized protein n=1 Tax=Elysia crispata TaxID=231223 RepID=A0AAE0YNJ3_9GAST|nr:hypothetical protein RRG08_029785 [Elysia crispata]